MMHGDTDLDLQLMYMYMYMYTWHGPSIGLRGSASQHRSFPVDIHCGPVPCMPFALRAVASGNTSYSKGVVIGLAPATSRQPPRGMAYARACLMQDSHQAPSVIMPMAWSCWPFDAIHGAHVPL